MYSHAVAFAGGNPWMWMWLKAISQFTTGMDGWHAVVGALTGAAVIKLNCCKNGVHSIGSPFLTFTHSSPISIDRLLARYTSLVDHSKSVTEVQTVPWPHLNHWFIYSKFSSSTRFAISLSVSFSCVSEFYERRTHVADSLKCSCVDADEKDSTISPIKLLFRFSSLLFRRLNHSHKMKLGSFIPTTKKTKEGKKSKYWISAVCAMRWTLRYHYSVLFILRRFLLNEVNCAEHRKKSIHFNKCR